MAILGVLVGITMCAVAWAIKESRDHRKLIIDLQNVVTFEHGTRISALERRKALVTVDQSAHTATNPSSASAKVAAYRPRTWNEDAPKVDAPKVEVK